MALGFTSHYSNNEHSFGLLTINPPESETAGSVASNDNHSAIICSLFGGETYDSYDFSFVTNIDYSQYANYVAASGSTETAGSVAFGGDIGTASTVSSFSGVSSCCCVSAATYTC